MRFLGTVLILFCMIFFEVRMAIGQSSGAVYYAGIEHRTDLFSELFDPQHITGVHVGTQREEGTFLLRFNSARRFGQTGLQVEAEAYPIIGDGYYAYLNYGYSGSSILPVRRAAGELYIPWPQRSEISVGLRYLRFDSDDQAVLATGSFNHYIRSFLVTLRPYFIFSDNRNGQTLTGSVRYFLNDRNDYILIRGGAGRSYDTVLFQLGGTGIGEDLLLLRSAQAGGELRHHLGCRVLGTISFDYIRQELIFDPGNFVTNYSVSASLVYTF